VSATPSYTIHCDGCGQSDDGDLGAQTAQERRDELKAEGWHVNRPGGRDVCDGCWEEGVR